MGQGWWLWEKSLVQLTICGGICTSQSDRKFSPVMLLTNCRHACNSATAMQITNQSDPSFVQVHPCGRTCPEAAYPSRSSWGWGMGTRLVLMKKVKPRSTVDSHCDQWWVSWVIRTIARRTHYSWNEVSLSLLSTESLSRSKEDRYSQQMVPELLNKAFATKSKQYICWKYHRKPNGTLLSK
jgi:hypothetical protein